MFNRQTMEQLRISIQSISFGSLWDIQTIFSSPSMYFYLFWLLFLLYWILAILRTMKDITSRTNNVFWQILAVLLVGVFTPLIGLPIYLFLRPIRHNWDRLWWRESLSVQVAGCPACAKKNPLHHEFCVYCGQWMTVKCKECKSTYQWAYDYCPQCGAANVE